jgi:hypothetical protein
MQARDPRIWQRFGEFDLPWNKRIELTKEYDDFVQSKIDAGWLPYLITFMFRALSGGCSSKLSQMKREIERFYSIFLTRVVRRPNSKRDKPILIGMADFPVLKWKNKSSISDVKINDGLHFHAILLIPPKSRLRISVEEHFEENSDKYLGDRKVLDRIDFEPITTETSYRVTDYVFKSMKRGWSYDEHVLILPKASSECRGRIFLTETTPGRLKER